MSGRATPGPTRRSLLAGAAASVGLGATGTTDARAAGPIHGKPGLRTLSDRPIHAEAPVRLLDAEVTPNGAHFVRNHGHMSPRAEVGSLEGWSLTVDGEVGEPLELTLADLKRLRRHEAQLVIECAGNGRAGFRPAASGTPWTLGAVGCARYTGVRLVDVLDAAGVRDSAVYVAYYGEDVPLSGNPDTVPISRGCPIEKALDGHTMLAWAMNGEPLPALHGFPLRLIVPGWPGSASGKWLTRLWVRDQVHDGPEMGGSSYRVPRYPVRPGAEVPEEGMAILGEMPVKSIMTSPPGGTRVPRGAVVEIRGHAWSGAGHVEAVHLSTDFGATWAAAMVRRPANRLAWQHFSAGLRFTEPGHYEVWARATDERGRMQPMVVPGWNPRGYLNNAMHRITIEVAA